MPFLRQHAIPVAFTLPHAVALTYKTAATHETLNRTTFTQRQQPHKRVKPIPRRRSHRHPSTPQSNTQPPPPGNSNPEWTEALEELLVEALRAYYQGTPFFSDAEFNVLREELEHLGLAQVRLHAMEKIWVQATSARDMDRRIRQEFDLSEEDLNFLKTRLLVAEKKPRRPVADVTWALKPDGRDGREDGNEDEGSTDGVDDDSDVGPDDVSEGEGRNPRMQNISPGEHFLRDAEKINAGEQVNERIKWFLFSDASEERFKIMLLYLPAVVMCFVTASVFTLLFALLDGEMTISVTSAGRFRLGILSYVVVMLTFWFSNRFTPFMLDYLDLGQPLLMRGICPVCGSSVSCLFTGATRNRDERKCSICNSVVGFNRKWSKIYLVSPPGGQTFQSPD